MNDCSASNNTRANCQTCLSRSQPEFSTHLEVRITRINVISLAPQGRSNALRGSQARPLDSKGTNDNAIAATSPVMAGINDVPVSMSASDGLQNRKRNVAMARMDSSPGSIEDMDDNDARDDKKRMPVKRACNECRQQKVSAVQHVRQQLRQRNVTC